MKWILNVNRDIVQKYIKFQTLDICIRHLNIFIYDKRDEHGRINPKIKNDLNNHCPVNCKLLFFNRFCAYLLSYHIVQQYDCILYFQK